jgi:hypothetical protein
MTEFVTEFENEINEHMEAKKREQEAKARAELRATLLENFGGRNSTLKQLFDVMNNSTNTAVQEEMQSLTLDELRATTPSPDFVAPEEEAETVRAKTKKGGGTGGGRKKKTTKKATKKAAKKTTKKTTTQKASAGTTRVRQDYAQLTAEILTFMKKQDDPISTGLVTETFGVNGTTARKAMEILVGDDKVTRSGSGRGTVYAVC